jgi:hypothetical protein
MATNLSLKPPTGDGYGKPFPDLRDAPGYSAVYSTAEFERIKAGFWPRQMEDEWAVTYVEP